MICVSLTGRSWKNLDVALMRNQQTIGVLTDRKKGPSEIVERMLYYGYGNYVSDHRGASWQFCRNGEDPFLNGCI